MAIGEKMKRVFIGWQQLRLTNMVRRMIFNAHTETNFYCYKIMSVSVLLFAPFAHSFCG